MLNEKALKEVKASIFLDPFCKPLYESYCFSQIPATIQSLLGLKNKKTLPEETFIKGSYDHVVFFFLDGFGWRFFEQFQEKIPFLKKCLEEGVVSVLTSLFPSTTSAHVTCTHTGLIPARSGIYEWFQYEPKLDAVIAPLLFSYARHKKEALPLDPAAFYPHKTIYQELQEEGVESHIFQPENITGSTYSQTLSHGANVHGYENLERGFDQLSQIKGDKTYRLFYFPDIDSIAHRQGTQAPELFEALQTVCRAIEEVLKNLPPKTAVMISADHGLIDISPKETYYLNKNIPNFEKFLQTGQDQKVLCPAGSCRDFFLHVKEDKLEECREILNEFLAAKAHILPTSSLIEEGLFGPAPFSKVFEERVGNLVILPFANEAVWWHEKGRFEQNFYAAHGGLTREEMEIPFIFFNR